MHSFLTSVELYFKDIILFYQHLCHIFVSEIYKKFKHLWVDGRSSLIALGAKVRVRSRAVIVGKHWNQVSSCFDPCQFPWCWLLLCASCASWAETAGKQYYSACHPDMTDLPSCCLYYQHQPLSGRILVHHHFWGGWLFIFHMFWHCRVNLCWFSHQGSIFLTACHCNCALSIRKSSA